MEANQEARSTSVETRVERDWLVAVAAARANALTAWDDYAAALDDYALTLNGARDLGVSVSDIAAALGISRTAVYKQLGKR